MHVKNGCLFSINALNKLIDQEKGNDKPNNEYVVEIRTDKDELLNFETSQKEIDSYDIINPQNIGQSEKTQETLKVSGTKEYKIVGIMRENLN